MKKISFFFFSHLMDGAGYSESNEKNTVNCSTNIHCKGIMMERIWSVMEWGKPWVSFGAGQWFHTAKSSINVVVMLQMWAASAGARLATAPPEIQSIHPHSEDSLIWGPSSMIMMMIIIDNRKLKVPRKLFDGFIIHSLRGAIDRKTHH